MSSPKTLKSNSGNKYCFIEALRKNLCVEAAQQFGAPLSKQEIEHQLTAAIENHQAGRLSEAAQNYQRVLDIDARNPVALNNYSLMLNDEAALKLLSIALDAQPNYTDALVNMATRCLNLGRIETAGKLLVHAEKLAPDDPRVQILQTRLASVLPRKIAERSSNLPTFSVLIPTHLRPGLLARALSSIKRQESQATHEIIVVSDCIDEKTDEVCRQWLAPTDTYIRRSGAPGPSTSRNLALQLAKGRFVLFLDDDDAWHPNFLDQLDQCEPLKRGLPVYFNCTVIKETREPEGPIQLSEVFVNNQDRLTQEVFVKNQLSNSTLAFPREVLSGIEFDTHMKAYEDWDFLLSVCERAFPVHVPILGPKIYEVDDATSDRRGSSQHANDLNAVIDYFYTYKKHPVDSTIQDKRRKLMGPLRIGELL